MLEPIRKSAAKIPELVIKEFLSAMEGGRLQVGEGLPSERELAKTLGISRASLRESLIIMEFLGIIEQADCCRVVAQGPEYIRRVYAMVGSLERPGRDSCTSSALS